MLRNLLLIQTDAQHHLWLSCRGAPGLRTPALDRLAREAAVFTNAFTCSGVCVPSRVSLMSGRYPIGHGVMNNNVPRRPAGEPWLGHLLQQAGIATGYFGKTHFAGDDRNLAGEGWATSFTKHEYNAYLAAQGLKIHYPEGRDIERFPVRFWTIGTSRIPSEHYFENVIARQAQQFIAAHHDQPFACYVSHVAPHGPFTPPAPYDRMYDPADMVLPPRSPDELAGKPTATQAWLRQNAKYLNDEELRIWLAAVYGLVTLIDDNVGSLLRTLDEHNLRQNTLVVFLSDHGDFAGRYGALGKSWTLTDDLVRIPLFIADPHSTLAPGGDPHLPRRVDELVQSIDVHHTILDWFGIEASSHQHGRSLLPCLRGQAHEPRDCVFACDQAQYSGGKLHLSMARTQRWKYVAAHTGEDELYDLHADPLENHNRIHDPACAGIRAELSARLLRWHLEHSGQFHRPETAAYWEDETLFYDETRFCGVRLNPTRGGAPTL